MKSLILPVKRVYFEQMRDGIKRYEYRLCTPYWHKRLHNVAYDQLVITLGYPSRDDKDRRLVMPYLGHEFMMIRHEHFGPDLVNVFAIKVKP